MASRYLHVKMASFATLSEGEIQKVKNYQGLGLNRGYYMVARRYGFYVRVAKTISHEWAFATLTRSFAIFHNSCIKIVRAHQPWSNLFICLQTQSSFLRHRGIKAVFHFTRIIAKHSVVLCSMSTRVELMILTQKKMLRYATIRLKWKTALIILIKD